MQLIFQEELPRCFSAEELGSWPRLGRHLQPPAPALGLSGPDFSVSRLTPQPPDADSYRTLLWDPRLGPDPWALQHVDRSLVLFYI